MAKILPGETDIYAITDAGLSLGRPLEEVASALLGAGVRILQYREKKLKAGAMLEECRLLRRLTAEAPAAAFAIQPGGVQAGAEGAEDVPEDKIAQLAREVIAQRGLGREGRLEIGRLGVEASPGAAVGRRRQREHPHLRHLRQLPSARCLGEPRRPDQGLASVGPGP